MRTLSLLSMALVPAALVAQAPAPTDYAAVLKAQTPEINGLLKDFNCAEALAKAESLLPAAAPTFDGGSPSAAVKSSVSLSGLTRLYLLAAKAAVQAGEWEKVQTFCTQADACARINHEGTKAALTPLIGSWNEAIDKAKKFVDENGARIDALQHKPGRTPAEEKEFQDFLAKEKVFNTTKSGSEKNEAAKFLNANVARHRELEAKATITPQDQAEIEALKVARNNIEAGPKTIKVLQDNIDATKAERDMCPPKIESTKKNLADEAAELEKGIADTKVKGKVVKETSGPRFEEKRAAYFENVLNTKGNFDSRPGKIERMNFLFRLRHNAAGTPVVARIDEVIARVKADQEPFPEPAKKAGKGKKAK